MINIGAQFGSGGTGLSDGTLRKALLELQSFKETVVDGAAANTDINMEGVVVGDTIASAIAYNAGVPSVVSLTITAAGKVQSSTNTTGAKIVVGYFKKP